MQIRAQIALTLCSFAAQIVGVVSSNLKLNLNNQFQSRPNWIGLGWLHWRVSRTSVPTMPSNLQCGHVNLDASEMHSSLRLKGAKSQVHLKLVNGSAPRDNQNNNNKNNNCNNNLWLDYKLKMPAKKCIRQRRHLDVFG